MNITDRLAPFFEGKESWESAVTDTCELLLEVFEAATFVCESCGTIQLPKIMTNERGIFVESVCVSGLGHICKKCAAEMMKG